MQPHFVLFDWGFPPWHSNPLQFTPKAVVGTGTWWDHDTTELIYFLFSDPGDLSHMCTSAPRAVIKGNKDQRAFISLKWREPNYSILN